MVHIGFNQTVIPQADIFISVVIGCLTFAGIIGNGLVLVAIATQRKLRKRSNALLFSLALLDFITCGPYTIWTLYASSTLPWPSDFTCRTMFSFGASSATTSCVFIALISINGLAGVSWRREYTSRGRVLVIFFSALGWVFMICIFAVLMTFSKGIIFQPRLGICYVNDENNETTLYFVITIFSVTSASWLISLCCYLKILNVVRMSSLRVAAAAFAPGPAGRHDVRNRRLLQLVVNVFITLMVFIVLHIPLFVIETLYRFGLKPHYLIHRVACTLIWSSSVINPYVYACRIEDVRKGINSMFGTVKTIRLCAD